MKSLSRVIGVKGFTIIELLIGMVVIGILTGLVIVGYGAVVTNAKTQGLVADSLYNSHLLKSYKADNGSYPTALDQNLCPLTPVQDTNFCLKLRAGSTFTYYTGDATTFALTLSNGGVVYQTTESIKPTQVIIAAPTCTLSSSGSTASSITFDHTAANSTLVKLEWGTSLAYGSYIDNPTSSVTINSLQANTKYYYKLTVTGLGGVVNCAGTAGDYKWTLPVIACSSTATTSSSGTLQFSGATSYTIDYGTTTGYGANTGAVSSPSVISGLISSTLYYYRVNGTGGGGDTSTCTGSFTTTAAAAPPTCSVVSFDRTATTIRINYSSTNTTSASLQYGTTISYGTTVSNYSTGVLFAGLTPDTKYFYKLTVTGPSGSAICGGTASDFFWTELNLTCTYDGITTSRNYMDVSFSGGVAPHTIDLRTNPDNMFTDKTVNNATSPQRVSSLSRDTVYYIKVTSTGNSGIPTVCSTVGTTGGLPPGSI